MKKSVQTLEALQRNLGVKPGQTTRDGLFSLEVVACLGACGLAPVVVVNDQVYGAMTPAGAVKLIEEIIAREQS